MQVKLPKQAKIGRFPVMALLQAARFYVLYGDLDRAKSFGLNRAIFYAWAKYYGPAAGGPFRRDRGALPRKVKEAIERFRATKGSKPLTAFNVKSGEELIVTDEDGKRWMILFDGEEAVPVGPHGWFEMGGKEQTPSDFDRQVVRAFQAVGIPFEIAWKAALEYVRKFPPEVLKSPSRFYKYVYEPVRDSFFESVIKPYVEKLSESTESESRKREAPSAKERREEERSGEVEATKRAASGVRLRIRRLDEFLRQR